MSEKFIATWFYAGHSRTKKEVRTGVLGLGRDYVDDYKPLEIDLDEFAQLTAKAYNDFDKEGYDVVNLIPLNMPIHTPVHGTRNGKEEYMGELGFATTKGAVVVGKRRCSPGEE